MAIDSMRWFTTSSGRIELQMTLADAHSGSHPGKCDEDIAALAVRPDIAAQLGKIDPVLLADELSEYGAWDETELGDHAQNLLRILWLACGDITDESLNDV